jgi:hypothetical protein
MAFHPPAGGSGTVTSVTSANTDVGVANSTTTPVLTLNSATLATANTILKRDASSNIYANNVFESVASTTSAGGTTILTIASAYEQILTGSSAQTYQLPDATTVPLSTAFIFNNNSSQSLTVTNAGATTLYTVPAGGEATLSCTVNGTANGSWDIHPRAPGTVTWGSGVTGLVFNTALTTSPSISAGISSAANPSFIPQRGSATTGYGGDSTNLYGSIAAAAVFTASSSNFTVPATVTAKTVITTSNAITATANAATVPITSRISTVTNNSAATLTITMTTTSAVDGQLVQVRVLDFSAVAQTITWVNTENGEGTAPTTSNGSTTLPRAALFQFNSGTTKWRCIAS